MKIKELSDYEKQLALRAILDLLHRQELELQLNLDYSKEQISKDLYNSHWYNAMLRIAEYFKERIEFKEDLKDEN